MAGLNRSQEAVVLSTLRHVSELLEGIARLTSANPSSLSVVNRDLSAYESRMLLALVGELQESVVQALRHLEIAVPPARVSARWSAITALRFADVALDGLSASSLRGYGELGPEPAAEVLAVVRDLRARLDRAAAVLSGRQQAELDHLIAAVADPAGELLREVRTLADEHGLPGIHAELAAVAERAVSPVADIGVFGRISSGKSSLINTLVGETVLPVGVTPMTAVPLRIQRGAAHVTVHYADGRIEELGVADLPTVATELANPHNRRGVLGLEVFVPGAPEGLRLLDTPGVAATRTTASAAAYAWLPRCDSGLVLVPAGAAVDPEDHALIRALQAAGVEYRVLLSKADLAGNATDLDRAIEYVRRELAAAHGAVIDVRPVSTADPSQTGVDWIRREILGPVLVERGADSRARLRRRLHHLVSSVESAIAGTRPRSFGESIERRRALDGAAGEVRRIANALEASAPAVLELAAPAVLAAWQHRGDGAPHVREAVGNRLATSLVEVREHVEIGLRTIGAADEFSEIGLPPLPDTSAIADLPDMPPPAFARTPLAARTVARRLAALEPRVADLVRSYADRLRRWGESVLERAADLGGSDRESTAPRVLEQLHHRIDSIEGIAGMP